MSYDAMRRRDILRQTTEETLMAPTEMEMREVAWRMLGGYDLSPFDLRVIGWCQRKNAPSAPYTESEE